MANTYVDYTAVASQTDYNFSFEYLRDEHVKVKVDDVIVTNYTIVTSPVQLIRFNTAPTAGAAIKIYRDSRGDFSPLVDFVDGSVLTENELDESYRHNLFVSQEASEGTGNELLNKKGGDNYDAEGNKIINLGTPTTSTDAANKAYTDQTIDNAIALGGSPAIVSLGGYDVTSFGTSITQSLANWTNTNALDVTATGSTTARTLADRFADVVNVLDYGASTTATTPTEIEENTTAFSNAIASGRTVYIPAGTFNINYLDLSGIVNARIIGESQSTVLSFGTGINNLEGDSCAVLINNGKGGDVRFPNDPDNEHPTASRRLRLDGFYIDANGLDIGIYIDKMTDSHLENIAIRDCGIGMKINYSWVNMFSNFDIQEFTNQGVSTTTNNINALVFTNFRVSVPASAQNASCYYLVGNSIKLISCDAEGSASAFTGMTIPAGRLVSIDGCHFENGTGIIYSSGNNVRSLSVTNSFFDCATAAITPGLDNNGNPNYANSLNITGCVFKDANSGVELNTLNGNFSGNYFDGTSTYTIGQNFKGYLHDGTRFISEKRLERQYIRIPTFSTDSANPTLLCTFPEYSRRTSGKILVEQRLSANNTSSQEINFAISEDETFRQVVVASVSDNLGITLSVVDNGDTRSIYGYGTYNSNLAGYIDLVTY